MFIPMQAIFKAVYSHPDLSQADLLEIGQAHAKVSVKKGGVLQQEGQVSTEYYLLESGVVRAFVHDYSLNEITTEFFTANNIVIIPYSIFQKTPSKETLQAITDCVLWKIDFTSFQQLFHKISGFREWGRDWFSSQVFTMKQRSLDMLMLTATERYLKLMKQNPDIVKNAPLKQIASYLGITDSSLSRIRRDVNFLP